VLHAYPSQLASFVMSRWGEGEPGLPDERALEALLSIVYQASILRDEDRPVTFRVVVASPDAFSDEGGPPAGLHRLRFTAPRAFDEHELRRLSQAAKYHRALIGVAPIGDEQFQIWGVVQSGPRWLPSARAGERSAPHLPDDTLVVLVAAPGRVEVSKGDVTIAELRGGVVTEPGMDVFESRWLPARFVDIRHELLAEHEAAQIGEGVVDFDRAPASHDLDEDVVRHVGQDAVRRALAIMREARHGGTIVFLPPSAVVADELRVPFLDVKYPFTAEAPRRRYRTVMLALLRALSTGARAAAAEAHEAIFELSQLIAALADVDGVVVLTRRFEILGFGAEIVGALPQVTRVARALDLDGTSRAFEAPDGVGTRHRSVYRLIAAMPEAVAIVVSQDGSVRFVASVEGDVTFWDHSSIGDMG
jgi:hypothetical protein